MSMGLDTTNDFFHHIQILSLLFEILDTQLAAGNHRPSKKLKGDNYFIKHRGKETLHNINSFYGPRSEIKETAVQVQL